MARARKPAKEKGGVKLYHASLGFVEPAHQAPTPQTFLARLQSYIDDERPREVWVETTAGDLSVIGHEAAARDHAVAGRGDLEHDRGGQDYEHAKTWHGVAAEIVVAKWTGRQWTGANRAANDVSGLEVRMRRCNPGCCRDETLEMLLQPYDFRHWPDTPFVLVIGRELEYRIVGWITPNQAKAKIGHGATDGVDPGNRGKPAVAVSQRILKPVDEFKIDAVRPYYERVE
jgi:hypothetical protein